MFTAGAYGGGVHVQLPGSIGSADVFDGVLGVMTEVAAKKLSSEEETFRDLSLMIFHNNWLGGYAQILPFAMVRPRRLKHYSYAPWTRTSF